MMSDTEQTEIIPPKVVKPYRDPIPGRGSIELRRTAGGSYSWVITIWADAIVTDTHLIGMVDSVQRVDNELRERYPE
jgi:hypothetical protein